MADQPVALTMHESVERSGEVRLALVGELDLSSEPGLQSRLKELHSQGRRVRLDLSRLEFIDAHGVGLLLAARRGASAEHGMLEIEPRLTPQVAKVFDLLGIEP